MDRSIPFQQNLSQLGMALVILAVRKNDIVVLLPLVPKLREVLPTLKPGDVITIE